MKRIVSVVVAAGCISALVFLFAATPSVNAQSGARTPQHQAAPIETRFWDWLSNADYGNWAAPTGEKADEFYPGKSPHGAFIKTHLNRVAAADPKELPSGSVIVKENFDKDKKLMNVTVMYKSAGYDPTQKDWWYAKYMTDGTVATMKKKGSDKAIQLAGKVEGCIECHQSAGGGDYAFFND